MKVTVSQSQLAQSLSMVSRAVSTRSTLPVLGNVLVTTDAGRLRLSATNLELGMSVWIGAQIDEQGSITVPARTFTDLISTLPNEKITLSLNDRTFTLNVLCGTNSTDIKGIDAQEFPPMPVPDLEEGIALNVSDLKDMIHQVAFAASTDEARPVLQGVSLSVVEQEITLAATDGFWISVRKAQLTTPTNRSIAAVIPARALNELARIAADGEQSVIMSIPKGRGQVLFHLRDAELVSQLIEGNFPDYKAILPKSFRTKAVISTSGLLKACRQAEIIARDGNNVIRLNLKPGTDNMGELEISAQSEETGKTEVNMEANIEGEALLIAFNVRFLREVLEVIKTQSVAIEMIANNAPGLVRPVGEDNFQHVIMPMHLG